MKTTNKIDRDRLRKSIMDEMNRLAETTGHSVAIWDAVVSLFSKFEKPHVLYLKADLPVIEKLADGFSTASVANSFAISSKDVYDVAEIWGITPLDFTLDFNPLLVYNVGMTLESFVAGMNEYLPVPIKLGTAKIVVTNILRYYELLEFLEEEENGRNRTT